MKLINNWQTTLILAASSGIGIIICQPSYAATLYNITDLGNLGSSEGVVVTGINNLGQAIGSSTTTEDSGFGYKKSSTFRTAPNSPINPATDNLVTLPNIQSAAYDINDNGQVVGAFTGTGTFSSPFRTQPNSPINLETDNLKSDELASEARAINNSGQVVVRGNLVRFRTLSYRTLPNSPVNIITDDIGNLGGGNPNQFNVPSTDAYGINDSGQVVGSSLNINSERHAFRTAQNSKINPATDDLGTLGGTFSSASGINNLGQVIGTSTNKDGQQRAFRTAPNSPITAADDLGTLGGTSTIPNDINNLGQVVGNSTIANGEQRAFLFDEGKMFDLNDLIPANSGFTLNYANGINDRGQIVAGANFTKINRIFLLTPIASTSIPEPSSGLGILSISALCASFVIKRKFSKR